MEEQQILPDMSEADLKVDLRITNYENDMQMLSRMQMQTFTNANRNVSMSQ